MSLKLRTLFRTGCWNPKYLLHKINRNHAYHATARPPIFPNNYAMQICVPGMVNRYVTAGFETNESPKTGASVYASGEGREITCPFNAQKSRGYTITLCIAGTNLYTSSNNVLPEFTVPTRYR